MKYTIISTSWWVAITGPRWSNHPKRRLSDQVPAPTLTFVYTRELHILKKNTATQEKIRLTARNTRNFAVITMFKFYICYKKYQNVFVSGETFLAVFQMRNESWHMKYTLFCFCGKVRKSCPIWNDNWCYIFINWHNCDKFERIEEIILKSRQPRERHLRDFGTWTYVMFGTLSLNIVSSMPTSYMDYQTNVGPYTDFCKGGGGGCKFQVFFKGVTDVKKNPDFEANFRGINSVFGENLHDFEIICPIRGVRSHPHAPSAYGRTNRPWLLASSSITRSTLCTPLIGSQDESLRM